MTRITNFGRKRTHIEATFNYNKAGLEDSDAESAPRGSAGEFTAAATNAEGVENTEDSRDLNGQPPKKKRKRGPRKKAGTKVTTGTADGGESGERGEVGGEGTGNKSNETSRQKAKKGKGKLGTLQGSPPLATPAHSKFTRTPSRTQRSFRKTAPQANSRAEC
jgi:hypothetical protein